MHQIILLFNLYASKHRNYKCRLMFKNPMPGQRMYNCVRTCLRCFINKTKFPKKLIRLEILFVCQQRFTLYILLYYYSRRRFCGSRPPGKPNIAMRAVGHVFQYGIIHPFTPLPQHSHNLRLVGVY